MSEGVGSGPAASAASSPSKAAKIWRRTRVGAGLVVALALAFWVTDRIGAIWPVFAIGCALSAGAVYEIGRMGRLKGRGWTLVAGGALAATAAVWLFRDELIAGRLGSDPFLSTGFACYATAGVVAFALALASRVAQPWEPAAIALWIVPPLPLMAEIDGYFGLGGLGALILLSKIGDIAGYYAGNAIGRHHPFKTLSPGKTTEGCVASFIAGALAGPLCVALGLLPETTEVVPALLAGAIVNLASQAGDLLESWVKRRAEVKDSSTWFGPSGGMLDVCDSLLVSVPVALATWPHLLPTP